MSSDEKHYRVLREEMLLEQLMRRGIRSSRVLDAMNKVPRHRFVPEHLRKSAYEDRALPLGPDQTISQPYIVGLMCQAADVRAEDRVLEVGTGSGYSAAVLSRLASEVYSIELDEELLERARESLQASGFEDIHLRCGNGFNGWSEHAPFDVIVITAAPDHIPRELLQQLGSGGRMVLPFGESIQELVKIEKTDTGLQTTDLGGVRFVPMKE